MLTQNLQQIINAAIFTERVVGTSIIVAQHGKIIFEQHAGWANREQQIPVTANTLFRLASMTKPIVSAAAMVLLEQGVLTLDAPITHWLPAFAPKMKDGKIATITLRHLLTHTSGLSYGFLSPNNEPYHSAGVSDGLDETVLSLDENLRRLATVPLLFTPGSSWCYSLSTDVLGAVLEQACHQPLSQIVATYITQPLNMDDTSFDITDTTRLAQAYADNHQVGNPARLMQSQDQVWLEGCGPINYAPSRIFNASAYPSGGAGMIGTTKDYLIFLETLRSGGSPILNSHSVTLLTQDAVSNLKTIDAGPGFGYSMGFAVIRDAQLANTPRHAGTYEWGGVYGTKMFVDPAMGLSVVILTNTALEGLMGKFPVDVVRVIYENI